VSLGTDIEIERAHRTVATVEYAIPVGAEDYSLEVTPQPLARDARLEVRLAVPEGWAFADSQGNRSLSHDGELRASYRTRSVPETRSDRSGIPALWEGFREFLEDPLF
jgi:hypothetical protein